MGVTGPGAPIPATITLVGSSAVGALAGLMGVAVIVWALTPHGGSSLDDALTVASVTYLVLHGVPVTTGEYHFSVPLVGWLILPVLSIRGTTRWVMNPGRPAGAHRGALRAPRHAVPAGQRTWRAQRVLASAVATYAVIGGLLAWGVGRSGVDVPIAGAAAVMAGIALLGAGWGVLPPGGLNRWLDGLPLPLARHLRMVPVAAGTIWLAGLILVAVAVVRRAPAIAEQARLLDPGVLGSAMLAVLGVAMLPAAAVWAGSLTVGQGFQLGSQTLIGPDLVLIGPLPALPWLAALPGAPAGWWWALLGVPLLTGIAVAGWLAREVSSPSQLVAETAGVAVSAGIALGVVGALMSGDLGLPSFGSLGVSPLPLGVAASGLLCAGGLLAVAVTASEQWVRARTGDGTVAHRDRPVGAGRR